MRQPKVEIENRVLLLAPTGQDTAVLSEALTAAGLSVRSCATVSELCGCIEAGAGVAVVADEVLTAAAFSRLADTLSRQSEWSDFPLIVMIGVEQESFETWTALARETPVVNASVLFRPVYSHVLVSAVRTALRSRSRQYQTRDLLRGQREVELALKAERELLQHRTAQLEATIDALPDGYILYNPDGSVSRMNVVAKEVLGYSDEELQLPYEQRIATLKIQTPSGETFPIERIPSNRALRGETVRGEVMKISRPHRDYWLSVSAAPIVAGEGTLQGVVMEFSDFTPVHELQEQLARERNFVNGILQTSGALIAVLDPERKFIRFNRACEQLTGYTADEVIGRSLFDLFIAEEEREKVERVWEKLGDGEAGIAHEHYWLTRSGDRHFIRWRYTVMTDDRGRITHLIKTGIDITDRKHLEEKRNRRAAELTAANRELESFTYSVSHDLRNPLNSIQAMTEVIRELYAPSLDEDARRCIVEIDKSRERMTTIIADLLRLSRISRQELELREVDLSAMAGDIVQAIRQSDPERRVQAVVEENMRVVADPGLIKVTMENLIGNAWKYTAGNEEPSIRVGTHTQDGQRVFFVRDNGAGFDMQLADKLFQPFQRLHREKEYTGTGIGLSIVKRIVDRHGGRIWAESEVGQGATFFFTLGEK